MGTNLQIEKSEVFENYLAQQEERFKPQLTELYLLVKSLVPMAEESLSYQVPCFKYIYMLVGVGVNKNFCSLYTMSSNLVKQIKDELAGCKISGMTIHFKPGEALPTDVITKIVLARIKENEAIAMMRGKKE